MGDRARCKGRHGMLACLANLSPDNMHASNLACLVSSCLSVCLSVRGEAPSPLGHLLPLHPSLPDFRYNITVCLLLGKLSCFTVTLLDNKKHVHVFQITGPTGASL
jgi:hypothetical protein